MCQSYALKNKKFKCRPIELNLRGSSFGVSCQTSNKISSQKRAEVNDKFQKVKNKESLLQARSQYEVMGEDSSLES